MLNAPSASQAAAPTIMETLSLLAEAEIKKMFGLGGFPCDGANLDAVAPLAAAIELGDFRVAEHGGAPPNSRTAARCSTRPCGGAGLRG